MAYAIVGWILVEVSSVLGPALRLPDWATSLVAFLLILGFPVALILSWAYELTPDGIERTEPTGCWRGAWWSYGRLRPRP